MGLPFGSAIWPRVSEGDQQARSSLVALLASELCQCCCQCLQLFQRPLRCRQRRQLNGKDNNNNNVPVAGKLEAEAEASELVGAKLNSDRSSLLLPPTAPLLAPKTALVLPMVPPLLPPLLLLLLLLFVASDVARPSLSSSNGHLTSVLGSSPVAAAAAAAAQVASSSSVINVKVGALLEESDHEQANMFIRTIKMINEGRDETIRRLLNVSNDSSDSPQLTTQLAVHLEPMVEFLTERDSSLEADSKVCQLIESGVFALLGPTDGLSIQHVQSICDNMEIPYFELRPFLGSPAALGSPLLLSSGAISSSAAISLSSQLHQAAAAAAALTSSLPTVAAAAAAAAAGNSQSSSLLPTYSPGAQLAEPTGETHKPEALTLNLYPPAHLLTSAYIDLIYAWNWSSFAIVYEQSESMIKLQDLFKESSGSWTSKWQIKLFQFHSSSPLSASAPLQPQSHSQQDSSEPQLTPPIDLGNATFGRSGTTQRSRKRYTFRDIFWRIKMSGETNVLLDVRTENLQEALKQAQQVGCMTERFSYLITSLDLHTIELEDFKYSRTRITALSMIEVTKQQLWQPLHSVQLLSSAAAAAAVNEAQQQQQQLNDSSAKRSSNQRSKRDHLSQQPQTTNKAPPVEQQPLFDERYLERLGVHVVAQPGDTLQSQSQYSNRKSYSDHYSSRSSSSSTSTSTRHLSSNRMPKYKLSPSVVLERSGSYMEPTGETSRDWSRREALLSSPASMGLLPAVDRDNEQRLFEFFVEQQERNLSRVRLSTASAILHDSLLLYVLGLTELGLALDRLPANDQEESSSFSSSSFSSASSASSSSSSASCSPGGTAQVRTWPHGSSLVNYMRRQTFNGLTGHIAFDQRGLRTDFKLDLLGMAPDIGLIKVGEWHSRAPSSAEMMPTAPASSGSSETGDAESSDAVSIELESARSYDELSSFYERELRRYNRLLAEGTKFEVPYTTPLQRSPNGGIIAPSSASAAASSASNPSPSSSSWSKSPLRTKPSGANLLVNGIIFERLYREQSDQVDTLIVTTKLSQPYFMLKETPNKLEGNDQYEGFAVDLIHELSKLVNFNYRWREVADKKYGSKEVLPNGSVVWNGMIGEIVRGQADLAIVDLTITAQREEAVDFTLPFMNTGISILFKKPTTKVTTLFSFLSPFSSDVWAYVLAAYCGISANLFLVGHLSPYEWADPHPCRHSQDDDKQTVLRNQFSLLNSFWFTIGSLMQQGSDLTPRSMSTRTIAGIWYFFTLIMISSYTANLAAFLTVEKVVYPIENVRDLSNQQEIKYGCVESGSTCTFFHDSQIDTYQRINETMRKFRTYVRSNDEGQKRVEEGKFAFFMESASIEYIVERNCNLTQIGGLLDSKGYGLATSKKSRLKRPYRTLLSEGILHLQETGMLHILKNRWWKERRGGGTCTDDGKGSGVTELSLANVGGVFVVLLGGLAISFLVAIAEFMWRARRSGSTRDRMCEEMMSDLKFALACKRSTKPVATSVRRPRRHLPAPLQSNSLNSRQMRNTKDCDPVLLHAMLTMLTQQQQQQTEQQRQTLARQTQQEQTQQQGRLLIQTQQQHRQTQRDETQRQTNCLAQSKSATRLRQQQLANEDFASSADLSSAPLNHLQRTSLLLANGQDERYTAAAVAHDHLCQDRHWHLQSNNQPTPQQLPNSTWHTDADKRRFLFAQQTMETTDDSLAMVIHQH